MEPWTFARTAWDEQFQPLRDAGLTLERVEQPLYWETHERALRAHFPPEVFFDLNELRPPAIKAAQARIAEASGGTPLHDFCIVRAGDEIAAMFSGHDKGDGIYRMWHTNIHPARRRKGLYRMILDGTIGYTRALGFDVIASEHAPGRGATRRRSDRGRHALAARCRMPLRPRGRIRSVAAAVPGSPMATLGGRLARVPGETV